MKHRLVSWTYFPTAVLVVVIALLVVSASALAGGGPPSPGGDQGRNASLTVSPTSTSTVTPTARQPSTATHAITSSSPATALPTSRVALTERAHPPLSIPTTTRGASASHAQSPSGTSPTPGTTTTQLLRTDPPPGVPTATPSPHTPAASNPNGHVPPGLNRNLTATVSPTATPTGALKTAPSPTPTSPKPASATPTTTLTATSTRTAVATATTTPTAALTDTPTATPVSSATATPTLTSSTTATATATFAPSETATATATVDVSATATPIVTDSATTTTTATPTLSVSATTTATATPTLTGTPTADPPQPAGFPLGLFDDSGIIAGSTSYFQTEINDLKSHHLDSVMITNGDVNGDGPILGVADQAGVNVYWGPMAQLANDWWPTSVPANLTTAENVISPLVTAVAGHPSLKGTYLVDEPDLSLATKVALGVQAYHQLDPSRLVFPNLIGIDRVGPIFQASNPDVMLIDVYPFGSTNPIGDFTMTGFGYTDLDMVSYIRTVASSKPVGTPLWIILQTHSFGSPGTPFSLRTPTPAEVRAENWLALGEGAHGIFWFIYSSEQGWTGLKDNPTLFDVVSSLSQRVSPLRATLAATHKTTDAFTASYVPTAGTPTPTSTPYASTLTDGTNTYVVVVNMDCINGQNLSVSSSLTGSLQSLETGQTYSLGSPIFLNAGDGTIFKLINGPVNSTSIATPTTTATVSNATPTATPTNVPVLSTSSFSDEFNTGGPAPASQWTFKGVGSSTANVNNLHPGDLRVTTDPSLNQGCWVGIATCDRLMETAPSGDFTIDTKLDTVPPLGNQNAYHSAGIMVWQDANNFLRFELQAENSSVGQVVVAHKVVNGGGAANVILTNLIAFQPPVYLRVVKSGSTWTLLYATDGVNYTTVGSFTQALTVNQIGLQVENEGDFAAFPYADFDYFHVSTSTTAIDPASPTSTVVANVTPTPTTTPSTAGTITPTPTAPTTSGTVGVPHITPDFSQSVQAWWANHPFNPNSPNYNPTILDPSPQVNALTQYGGNIQAAINALPASGGTVYLPAGTYNVGEVDIKARSHIHVVGDPGAVVHGWFFVLDCNYSPSTYVSGWYSDQTCYTNQAGIRDFYFKNLTMDGSGTYPYAFLIAGVDDVVVDNSSFQNYNANNSINIVEPGYFSGHSWVNNVWVRNSTFHGGIPTGFHMDGWHASGLLNNTFTGAFSEGAISGYTNQDHTVDANGDGVIDDNENRQTRFFIVQGNTFDTTSGGYSQYVVNLNGRDNLVAHNTVIGNVPSPFFLLVGKSSYVLQNYIFHYVGNVIDANTLNGDISTFAALSDTACCQTGWSNYPDGGNTTISNNVIPNAPSFSTIITESGIWNQPDTITNNCINHKINGTGGSC
jgi:hypothetical protein